MCLFAGSAFATCTDPGTPHAITGNFSIEPKAVAMDDVTTFASIG